MEDKQDHNRNNHNHKHSSLPPTAKEDSPRKTVIGGGGGGDRLKRDEWSEGAVSTLLDAYESKWILRNRAKLKGHDWEDVARHVSSRASSTKSPKTQTQCKNKIESMKKRYRSESATGDAASSWPLYSRLDLLLRGTGPPPSSVAPLLPPPSLAAAVVPSGLILLESPLTVSSQPPQQPLPPPLLPGAAAEVAPLPLAINAQNSHGSNGVDRLPKEDMLGTNKSSEQVSNKNNNDNAVVETDSSTPALYSQSKDPPTNKRKMKMMKKKKRMRSREENSSNNHDNNNSNKKNGNMEIAESIRWLAEVVVRSEQARMETMKEIERMRAEAEAKRGEMDLKRTEIIANTQLEIARIFASVNNKGVDSSLRIGRS